MKKKLKIAMLLGLVLALMLTTTACLEQLGSFVNGTTSATTPEVTTPEVTTPETTTPEITTPEPQPDPDMPEGGVLVESIGGKNAEELLESFANDFSTATSYDWSAKMVLSEEDFSMTQDIAMKLHNGEFSIFMETDGELIEICFVDDVLYMNTYGEKIQIPADSIDAFLGEGALDDLLSMTNEFEISDAVLAAASDAKIYLLDGKYVVTVHYISEDTNEEETSVFYFNAAGEMLEAQSCSDFESVVLTIHSCGKPVEINRPADADDYILPGNETPEVPEGAVPVDTVNGMNASQLLDKFLAEYPQSTTFDIEMFLQEVIEDEIFTIITAVKVSADAVYYLMDMDGKGMEIWVVDNVAYMNMDGQKLKQEDVAIDDIFEEGTLDSLILSVIKEMPDIYYTYVNEAQLYELDGSYFFTVSINSPETGLIGFTETIVFDETGAVVRIIDEAEDTYMTFVINSYGKPVEVLPPADADEYVAEEDAPGGTVTPELSQDEIYALYKDACTTLQNSDHYSAFFNTPEMHHSINYDVAGKDKALMILEADGMLELWYISYKGYAAFDGGDLYHVKADDAFFSYFTSTEEQFPITVFAKSEIQNMTCSYDEEWGETVIEFEYVDEFDIPYLYRYALADDNSYVDVAVFEIVDGETEEILTCLFRYDPDLKIVLPEFE